MVENLSFPVAIRPMAAGDLERVHEIDVLSFSAPWPLSSYRFELFENPAGRLWVAEAQPAEAAAQIVGMIVVWLIVDEAHIATLAVDPSFRGHGIGQRLLFRALSDCVGWGARSATLEVRASNLAAQSLYRDFGFEVVGQRPHYYIDNDEDALIMTLEDMNEEYLEWLAE